MPEQAKTYLESITSPLAPGGVEILEEQNEMGMTYVVIPKHNGDYGALIGEQGAHADAIRTMMRCWAGVHTSPVVRMNVLIPNPKKIRTEYV